MTARTRRSLLTALLAAFGVWVAVLAVYQVDDAYITYRYAENIAHGIGFVFNAGERVEGVSCFLWTLVLSLVAAMGLPLPVVTPILTGIAGAVTVALLPSVSASARGREAADAFDLGAAALLAASPAFAYWSVGALETVPYTLLLVLAFRGHVRESARGSGARSAVWMGLATLMRPEARLLAAALGVDRARKGAFRPVVAWCGLVAAFYAPFLVFRRLYFGDWLPNTYYAKAGGDLLGNVEAGGAYTARFFSSLCPSFGEHDAVTAAVGGAVLAALVVFGLRRPALRGAALIVVALLVAVLLEGGDWMILHRFFVPALPFVAVLVAAAVGAIADRATRKNARTVSEIALALGVAMIASLLTYGLSQRNGGSGLVVNAAGYSHAHRDIALFIKGRAHPGDAIAVMDVGIIGYLSGLEILDISGLTTPEIAHAPGRFMDKEFPPSLVLAKAPRFMVLVQGFPADTRISDDPEFRAHYRLLLQRNQRFNWKPPSEYWLGVFERM